MSPDDAPSSNSDLELEGLCSEFEERFVDRWAGAWRDRDRQDVVSIAIADLTGADASFVEDRCRRAGWKPSVLGVRYSLRDLERFSEAMTKAITPSGAVVAWGSNRSRNKVIAHFTRPDPDAVARILEVVPRDAVAFDMRPGSGYRAVPKSG